MSYSLDFSKITDNLDSVEPKWQTTKDLISKFLAVRNSIRLF